MAYFRCQDHPPRNLDYSRYVLPVGYPNTALICGASNCSIPGYIWLNDSEQQYASGVRIFPGPNNNFTKMKAEPTSRVKVTPVVTLTPDTALPVLDLSDQLSVFHTGHSCKGCKVALQAVPHNLRQSASCLSVY